MTRQPQGSVERDHATERNATGLDEFARAVRQGLRCVPRSLPCRFLYDANGSELFEAICSLDEYYIPRVEAAVLRACAHELVEVLGPRPRPVVELGPGSARKILPLLERARGRWGQVWYVPVDISRRAVEMASANVRTALGDGVHIEPLIGEYREALGRLHALPGDAPLIAWLGSSVGNMNDDDAGRFVGDLARAAGRGAYLLMGADMVKPLEPLLAAYDDASGITEKFSRNLLVRINRELGADFAPEAFRHLATWDAGRGAVRIELECTRSHGVRIPGAGIAVEFEAGERIHIEDSHKYTPERLDALLDAGCWRRVRRWSDARGWFTETLAVTGC